MKCNSVQKKEMEGDFLIVGAGIAGQMLARALTERGQSVTLAHDPNRIGSSSVAAWMINPVTGIRFVPCWRVETFLTYALELFSKLESEMGTRIWHPSSIVRLFQGDDEVPRWNKKRERQDVRKFVLRELSGDPGIPGIQHKSGGIVFQFGGWINLGLWLRHQLENPPEGLSVTLLSNIEHSDSGELQNRFSRIIYCTGYSAMELPWKPAKGELLTVRIPGLNLDQIILRGIFVIPLGHDCYRVGATYEWDDLTPNPTESGTRFLEEKLSALIALPYEILDRKAGIRPILKDARPVIGLFSDNPNIGVCNGFGSKAALMAPWICNHFADHLVSNTPLDPELDFKRIPEFTEYKRSSDLARWKSLPGC